MAGQVQIRILQKAQISMSFLATKRRREQWPSNSSGLLLHCAGIVSVPIISLTSFLRIC